MQHLLFPV